MAPLALRKRVARASARASRQLPLTLLLWLPLLLTSHCHAARLTRVLEHTGARSLEADSQAEGARLGPAPTFDAFLHQSTPSTTVTTRSFSAPRATGSTTAPAGLSVDTATRATSKAFYWRYYMAKKPNITWTGSLTKCMAGTTSQDFRNAVVLRINYFRAMAGVPAAIKLNSTLNAKAQQAALMMSANSALNHFPPTSWRCYTKDGAESAGNSNLALGASGWDAISLYIRDPGDNNQALGHRRWVLYPQTRTMGTGDVPLQQPGTTFTWLSNDLWVFDTVNMWGPRPATRNPYVAWPPPGYVPFNVVHPRWSFAFPLADFSKAKVTMTRNGRALSLKQFAPMNGYGDNTLAWELDSIPAPTQDTRYTVTITSVGVGGQTRRFTYTVIVFDPAK